MLLKSKTVLCGIFFSLLFTCLIHDSAPAALQASAANYHFLLLTPGHSQTLYFELANSIFNDTRQYHCLYILTVGAGTVTVRVGPSSSVGDFASIVYGVAGIIGIQPVARYGYNAETISMSASVPVIGAGLVLSAITVGSGSPDYPIVMSMVVSLCQ